MLAPRILRRATKFANVRFAGIVAPGRLGNPLMHVGSDPRVDPRQKLSLAEMGMDGAVDPVPPMTVRNTWEEKYEFIKVMHQAWMDALEGQETQGATKGTVKTWTETIKDVDGGELTLYCAAPTTPGPHPVILEIHGSGLVCYSPNTSLTAGCREQLAELGAIVIAPDYRKVAISGKAGQFPAGLNDCLTTLDWIHANMTELCGAGKVVAMGPNGGGNIAQAMALKLNAAGNMNKLNGVFSMGPMLYGQCEANPDFLNSVEENRNYIIHNSVLDVYHDLYDGGNSDQPENATNPLARPHYASVEQMKGLCPHAFTLNECGQWRDEGIAYVRKLKEAGVKTNARIIVGSVIAGQFIAGKYAQEMWKFTARAIIGFAKHGTN